MSRSAVKPSRLIHKQGHGKATQHLGEWQSAAVRRETLPGEQVDQSWPGLGRREHPGLVAPVTLAEWWLVDATAGQQAGDDRERDALRRNPTEGEHVLGQGPLPFQGSVLTVAEECGMRVATGESFPDHVELDPRVISPVYKVSGESRPVRRGIRRLGQLLEHASSEVPVDRTPVVGIDQV